MWRELDFILLLLMIITDVTDNHMIYSGQFDPYVNQQWTSTCVVK